MVMETIAYATHAHPYVLVRRPAHECQSAADQSILVLQSATDVGPTSACTTTLRAASGLVMTNIGWLEINLSRMFVHIETSLSHGNNTHFRKVDL